MLTTSIINPYYDEALPHLKGLCRFKERDQLVTKYAWSIPTNPVIGLLSSLFGQIVEIGAGTGYWASLLQQCGAQVVPFDKHPQHNPYRHHPHWVPVYEGTEEVLSKFGPRWTLLLGWPPYEDSMAEHTLAAFRGKHLIYIGEDRWGCCATHEFFQQLDQSWTRLHVYELPQWSGIHDQVEVWERGTRKRIGWKEIPT